MDRLNYKLDRFEGPLDLLLYLISRHKLDIKDIQISVLVEQYLDYMEHIDFEDFEYSGEFLEMAARLIYIKTVSLLPKPNNVEDMKKELQGALIEYSLCKSVAKKLALLYIGDDVFIRQQMYVAVQMKYTKLHNSAELMDTYLMLLSKIPNSNKSVEDKLDDIVSLKFVTVTSKIIRLLRCLYINGKVCINDVLHDVSNKSERIATFLAVLELAKSGRILLNEDNSEAIFNGKFKRGSNL